MKLRTIKKYNNELLSLNLIKLKLYKKKQQNNFGFNIKQIEFIFKKILQIIYKYHIAGKKILFLEFPKILTSLLKKTKHTLIPKSISHNGMFGNRNFAINKDKFTKTQMKIPLNIIKILLKLKKKASLVIVSNLNRNNTSTFEESYNSIIPIISVSSRTKLLNEKITYKIPTSSGCMKEKIINSNFLLTIVKTTLKKAIRHKKPV